MRSRASVRRPTARCAEASPIRAEGVPQEAPAAAKPSGAGGAGGVLAAAAAERGDAPNRRRRRAEKGRKAKKLRALAKIRE